MPDTLATPPSPKTMIKLRYTYAIITDESAARGEASENGWYSGGRKYSIDDETAAEFELVTASRAIRDIAYTVGAIDSISDHATAATFYPADAEQDYRTGGSTRYYAHIEGDARLIAVIAARLSR